MNELKRKIFMNENVFFFCEIIDTNVQMREHYQNFVVPSCNFFKENLLNWI